MPQARPEMEPQPVPARILRFYTFADIPCATTKALGGGGAFAATGFEVLPTASWKRRKGLWLGPT
jgi:hypothetical protein